MKPVAKGVLTVAIIGGLAALVIVTKPGPRSGRLANQPAAASPHPARPAPHPGSSTTASASAHTTATTASAPTSATMASASPNAATASANSSAASAPAAVDSSWREHGKTAVVRSHAELGARPAGLLPLKATPSWDEPTSLKFFHLKKHYRAFKRQGHFEPDTASALSGAAVQITGAFMPIDPIPDDGRIARFWLANPVVVMAGCVFCTPPTMADLLYVTTDEPVEVDRETLFRSVLMLELLGRLRLGPHTTSDGVQYLFGLELRERIE